MADVSVSGVLVLAAMAALLAWDITAYYRGYETESTWVRAVSRRPALPFCGGVLVGHFWFT